MIPSLAKASAGALAVGLLVLGVPQTVDSAWRLSAEAGVDLYSLKGDDAEAAARAASPRLEAIDARLGDPEAALEAAILRLELVAQGDDAAASADLAAATQDLDGALARLPGNALGWYELADARFRSGDVTGARGALRTSMLMGFYDPQLNLARTELGMLLWLSLDANDLRMVEDQVRFTWQSDPAGLLKLAGRDPWMANFIRHALDEDSRPAFDRALNARP